MTTTFAAAAAGLFLIRLVLFAALHLVRSDYNLVEHAVSDYAVGPTRRLSSAMTWVTAAGWACLAVAVWSSDWDNHASVGVWLAILAVLFVALPIVPTDLEGARRTTIGRLHYLLAIAWFAISYTLTGTFHDHLHNTALNVLRWVAVISLAALVIALAVRPLRPKFFGISERVFILAINLFYLIAAAMLISG
ncbi:DUF998 domain-containing protein [Kribbella sp. NPDC006257]|uniref:DUF998 domain-containing protein n=1 Tax=Kribbella sp. NPDC006257 TaxID=3156738 RepID=UPI0033B3E29D